MDHDFFFDDESDVPQVVETCDTGVSNSQI
jgi:hypothetical protein